MGLLRLLGIEKYLKKVKTYVDEENVKDRAYTDKKVSENKTATPDWDAESWEAGYIKNRTHGLTDLTVLTKNGETAYGMLETQYLKFRDELFPISRGETVILRQGPDISVTYENDQLTLNDPEDVAESLGSVAVAIGINRISEHYIPDTIARYSQIEDLYNALEALTNRIEWHSVYEGDMKNMLDQNLTLSQMTQLGFSAVINNPYTIKGVIVEGDVNTTALAVSSIHSANGDVYGIEFGNISKYDTGAELILSKKMDGTWVITYIEA